MRWSKHFHTKTNHQAEDRVKKVSQSGKQIKVEKTKHITGRRPKSKRQTGNMLRNANQNEITKPHVNCQVMCF